MSNRKSQLKQNSGSRPSPGRMDSPTGELWFRELSSPGGSGLSAGELWFREPQAVIPSLGTLTGEGSGSVVMGAQIWD